MASSGAWKLITPSLSLAAISVSPVCKTKVNGLSSVVFAFLNAIPLSVTWVIVTSLSTPKEIFWPSPDKRKSLEPWSTGAFTVCNAPPWCTAYMTSPFAGVPVNVRVEPETVYALPGCCLTFPIKTSKSFSVVAFLERVNAVALPSPVKLSLMVDP